MKGMRKMTLQERIIAYMKIDDKGCWICQLTPTRDGYVLMRWQTVKTLVHRLAYEAFVGPIPEGLSVLHTCDVRACCNPNHLFPGTYSDNSKDAVAKGRQKNLFPSGDEHPKRKAKLLAMEEV
jgi:hypothetical protein